MSDYALAALFAIGLGAGTWGAVCVVAEGTYRYVVWRSRRRRA